jgi:hypothetical protein
MMSTAGGDDTAAQGNPSAAAHQPRAPDNQNPTTATSNLVSPPPQQTPVPLRPLSPLRLTSPPPASQPAENNEQPSRNNEQSLAETLENDWDYVQGTFASYQNTHNILDPDLRWVGGYGYLPILVFAQVGNEWVTQYPKITGRMGIFRVGKK